MALAKASLAGCANTLSILLLSTSKMHINGLIGKLSINKLIYYLPEASLVIE